MIYTGRWGVDCFDQGRRLRGDQLKAGLLVMGFGGQAVGIPEYPKPNPAYVSQGSSHGFVVPRPATTANRKLQAVGALVTESKLKPAG